MTTTVRDDKGTETRVIVTQDEGIRPNTTMEGLAKLKPAFKDNGSTTAGTSGWREWVLLCPLRLHVPPAQFDLLWSSEASSPLLCCRKLQPSE